MTRQDGFDRLDLATDVHHDPKFRALARRHPDLWPGAFAAYVVLLAESWREGARLTLDEAWPPAMPDSPEIAAALTEARLVGPDSRIPEGAWESWYGEASQRRTAGRERQRRADIKRGRIKPPPAPPSMSDESDSPSGRQAGPPVVQRTDQRRSNAGETREPTDEDAPSAAAAYLRLTGHLPRDRAERWLAEMVEAHGDEAVSRALASEHDKDPDLSTLLSRTRKRLGDPPRPMPKGTPEPWTPPPDPLAIREAIARNRRAQGRLSA